MASARDRAAHGGNRQVTSPGIVGWLVLSLCIAGGVGMNTALEDVLQASWGFVPELPAEELRFAITSYGLLAEPPQFAIAYYREVGSSLPDELRVIVVDPSSGKTRSRVVQFEGLFAGEPYWHLGSVLALRLIAGHLFINGHSSPSAGDTLILNPDLAVVDRLPGGVRAFFRDGLVVFRHGQVHFAPTHPEALSLYDLASGKTRQIYPPRPYSSLRRSHIEKVAKAYASRGDDWMNQHNHHGDPERFSESLGEFAIDDSSRSFAFVTSFENREYWTEAQHLSYRQLQSARESPGRQDRTVEGGAQVEEPDPWTRLLYVYRNPSLDGPVEFRCFELEDFRRRFPFETVQDALRPSTLQQIFVDQDF